MLIRIITEGEINMAYSKRVPQIKLVLNREEYNNLNRNINQKLRSK